jgi:hypothetical protein
LVPACAGVDVVAGQVPGEGLDLLPQFTYIAVVDAFQRLNAGSGDLLRPVTDVPVEMLRGGPQLAATDGVSSSRSSMSPTVPVTR